MVTHTEKKYINNFTILNIYNAKIQKIIMQIT